MIRPPLPGALAQAGHGSVVLLADGNYPYATAVAPQAETIWLNLRPGQIPVDDVLETLLGVVPVGAARVMATETGEEPDIYARFRELIPAVELQPLAREDFYATARVPELAVAVAADFRDERGDRRPTPSPTDERFYLVLRAAGWKIGLTFWLHMVERPHVAEAERVRAATEEQKLAILRLKSTCPDYPDQVSGIDIYTAVLHHGVRTTLDFDTYLSASR